MTVLSPDRVKPRYEGLHVSREEYLDLEEDGFKYDMIDGVLYMTPSPGFEHGELEVNFSYLLRNLLYKKKLGRVVVETDVLLPDGGDVLRPDVSFIFNENLNIVKCHIHGAPDLVGEVLSDRTDKRDLGEKAQRYLACGVKEYWLIDPRNETIQCWVNKKDHWEKIRGENIESRLIPGLVIQSRRLF